jgi:hypothetical protein
MTTVIEKIEKPLVASQRFFQITFLLLEPHIIEAFYSIAIDQDGRRYVGAIVDLWIACPNGRIYGMEDPWPVHKSRAGHLIKVDLVKLCPEGL